MNKMKIIFLTLLTTMLFITSCQDPNPELGAMLDQSQIDFEVTQDFVKDPGGNTVILTNNTPGTVSMWDYSTGRSTRAQDTVRFPFKGEYEIKFSALTAGGVVEMEPVIVVVTDNNFTYVNDPLWTNLTGGVGNEKTWLLDLDADGVSKYFSGPVYFSSDTYDPNTDCIATGACWMWDATWKDNQWIGAAGDYGTMKFSLVSGADITVDHKMTPVETQVGTYFLDVSALTLSLTDVEPLHNPWANGDIGDWSTGIIISLTEETMQLAYHHKTKAEFMIFNYISQEYSDNWVPPVTGPPLPDDGFEPTFASGELLNMLTGGAGAGRIWELDGAGNPVDWLASGKGWTKASGDSYNWGWNDNWTAASGNSWIRFDQYFGTQTYTLSQNGVVTTSTFTINEATNEITLGGTNTLITDGGNGSWMNPSTNVITVIKGWSDEFQTKGIWFGTSYDAGKDEWFVFHYILP